MAEAGPRKIAKYGDRFKATAVKLSSLPGVQIKDVAAALDIHPFMLSLWRRQVRIWAAIIAILVLLAMLPGFAGLLIVGPVLGHASWHAYRASVERGDL